MIVLGGMIFMRLPTWMCASMLTHACAFGGNFCVPSYPGAGIRHGYGLVVFFGVGEQNAMLMPVQQAFYYWSSFPSLLYLTSLVFKGILWKLFQNLPRIVQNKIYLQFM